MGRAASGKEGRRCLGQHRTPFLIVPSSPGAQGISGATSKALPGPQTLPLPWVSPGPGLLEECRLSGAVVAIGGLAQDQKCPQALMEGRSKHLENRPLTALLSYLTAALDNEDPGARDSTGRPAGAQRPAGTKSSQEHNSIRPPKQASLCLSQGLTEPLLIVPSCKLVRSGTAGLTVSSQRCVPSPHLGVSCGLPRPMGLLAKFSIPSRLLGQDNPEPRGLGPIFCCPVSQTSPADTEHPVWRLRSGFPQLGPRWGPGNICRTRVCL